MPTPQARTTLGALALLAAWLATPAPPVTAQVIQLPTFRSFGVGTTVQVPTSGSALLGSSSQAITQTTTRTAPGLPLPGLRRRTTHSTRSVSLVTAHVTLIDLTQLDRQVLAEAARLRAQSQADHAAMLATEGKKPLSDQQKAKADFLNRHIGRH